MPRKRQTRRPGTCDFTSFGGASQVRIFDGNRGICIIMFRRINHPQKFPRPGHAVTCRNGTTRERFSNLLHGFASSDCLAKSQSRLSVRRNNVLPVTNSPRIIHFLQGCDIQLCPTNGGVHLFACGLAQAVWPPNFIVNLISRTETGTLNFSV